MKNYLTAMLAGSSILALAPLAVPAAHAQATDDAGSEIIVTARRRDERLQDVPLTVNAVSADTLQDLNIQRMDDIETIVPGFNVNSDVLAPSASLRGVEFNTYASGNNATVENYVNDAPLTAPAVFQGLFDIGQIEVLRGPQGTLRGRASPSGSITVTTHRPDLYEYGGFLENTFDADGGINTQGAVNIPLIEERLGIRIAGLFDEDDGNGVESINSSQDPFNRTTAGRFSVLFEPTDDLTVGLTHQRLVIHGRRFVQVESANLADPSVTAAPAYSEDTPITAGDRLAVGQMPEESRSEYEVTNFQFEYRFAGQKFNYVGSHSTLDTFYTETQLAGDAGDFFGPPYSGGSYAGLDTYAQTTRSTQTQESHEIRLSSDERLFGVLDYVVGAFTAWSSPDTSLTRPTALFYSGFADLDPGPGVVIGPVSSTPGASVGALILPTFVTRLGETEETSVFANVNWHISDATELSAGTRYISYQDNARLAVDAPGTGSDIPYPGLQTLDSREHAQIYNVSLKHNFTDDFMAYATVGSSWRPGISATGDFNRDQSAVEAAHVTLESESSTSYEIGFKSEWFDNRVRLNVTAYHQEFENYPYRGGLVYFVNDTNPADDGVTTPFQDATESISSFNFVSAVPVEVDGLEIESSFQILENWNLGALISYSHGEIMDGLIACNDLNGDGVQDTTIPTVIDIENDQGGDSGSSPGATNINECAVTQNSSFQPEWSASLQSEYTHAFSDSFEGFLRGQLSWYDESENDPQNPFDDVDSYSILNLYAGIRAPDGAWDLTFYVKNATDTEEVLTRGFAPISTSYVSAGNASTTGVSNYRAITMTPEQEVGVTLRYAFGSR